MSRYGFERALEASPAAPELVRPAKGETFSNFVVIASFQIVGLIGLLAEIERLQSGILFLHVRNSHNHPRLAVVVPVFGEHQIIGQIDGGVLDFLLVIYEQDDVAINAWCVDLIIIILYVLDRIIRVVEAVVGFHAAEIERGPVTVHGCFIIRALHRKGIKMFAGERRQKKHQINPPAIRQFFERLHYRADVVEVDIRHASPIAGDFVNVGIRPDAKADEHR